MASAVLAASLGVYKPITPIITEVGSSQECQIFLEPGQAIAIVGYGYITVKSGDVECFGARINASHGKITFFSPECYSLMVFSAPIASSCLISLCEGNIKWRQLTSFLDLKDIWGDGGFLSTLKSKCSEIYSIFEGLHAISLSEESINTGFSYLSPMPLWKDLSGYLGSLNPLSVVVFGSKGSGKSTFLKYLINSSLSQHQVNACSTPRASGVLLMNLDCGQAELGPPATVSLFHIDKFILGPSFATQCSHIHQEYVGVISIAENPKGYLHAVERLCNFLHKKAPKGLPVFVNTMGWTTGLGLELFKCTINLVRPSTIIPLMESVTSAEDLSSSTLVKEAVQKLSSTLCEPPRFRTNFSISSVPILPTILPTSAISIAAGRY
ncbi:hypothetical protein DI09_37p40 [Mitosporidium daphniae]|uniref:Polynucleotide 5'-hydroxyl-kinase GRC3 n=1 Tax=Mitosporidium daphniae TaxID=1485682 RepID=A0A098VQU5_9MICR|nr:uncharacterized protein DI09_37p40 [Mitosporidium daphniae]KGG51367.1 hypothetical protein DI09_37p40 [Mitosporidium daphniae]|eukprot:XP_013237815.1 uncharacterized protein DI09_37p40 [Mitosporidium daphniae]